MPKDKPNVVFILTDDQGVWAAGCYGNDEIRTPNIDRIAETGVRFENFFVATPVCSVIFAWYLAIHSLPPLANFRNSSSCG